MFCFVFVVPKIKAKKWKNKRCQSMQLKQPDIQVTEVAGKWAVRHSVSLWPRGSLPWQAARAAVMSVSLRIPENAILIFCLWTEERRAEQRTEVSSTAQYTHHTQCTCEKQWCIFSFTTVRKQSTKYKNVPNDNMWMIAKVVQGLQKAKKPNKTQLISFAVVGVFLSSPNFVQSETL